MNSYPGTTIIVSDLHPATAESLGQQSFLTRLAKSLGVQHQQSIFNDLIITLNGSPVGGSALELLNSDSLHPGVQELKLYEDTESPVLIRIYVGLVSDSYPADAGWYIYGNSRLVLGADKSPITGWGAGAESQFPIFHNRYGRFRGYVFYDCDDASKLPWTMTKTGIDSDSPVYRRTLQEMLILARPVTTFLQNVSREVEQPPEDGSELEPLIGAATPLPLASASVSSPFTYSRPPGHSRPVEDTQSIQYRRPRAQIQAVKRALGVGSASEAGQRTFGYFLKNECNES